MQIFLVIKPTYVSVNAVLYAGMNRCELLDKVIRCTSVSSPHIMEVVEDPDGFRTPRRLQDQIAVIEGV